MNQHKKTRSVIALTLTLFMVVSALSAMAPALAADAYGNDNITFSLVPSMPIDLTYPDKLTIGATFTVAVNINNVAHFDGVSFDMNWPTDVVHAVSIEEGPFIKSAGGSPLCPDTTIDNSQPIGRFPSNFNDALLNDRYPSGSGTIATITFEVVGFGSGTINIPDMLIVSDSDGTEIPIGPLPSIPINNPTPPAYGPTAAFSVSATTATVTGAFITIPATEATTDITLDASSSVGGYTGSESAQITAYSWKVNGNIVSTTQTVTLKDVAPGPFAVELTVTATGATPETDTKTVSYTVVQAEGTGIDVYTLHGGKGANVPVGPFGPQQEVVAYASVLSNGSPVAQKDVAFQINKNDGTPFTYRSARTDDNGIATISFRLITPDTTLEAAFGDNWAIVATVDISEQKYSDSAKFTFNYLANIGEVSVTPSSVDRGHSNTVQITADISAIEGAVISPDTIVTFSVVDSNNVPIAVASSSFATGQVSVTVGIVNYAFTGQAKVYVNILSNQPIQGGTPYCPQNGATVSFDSDGLFTGSLQNPPAQFLITYKP